MSYSAKTSRADHGLAVNMVAAQGKDQYSILSSSTQTGKGAKLKAVASSSDEALANLRELAKGKKVGDTVSTVFTENGQVKVYTASVNEFGVNPPLMRNATVQEKAKLQGNDGGTFINATNQMGATGTQNNDAGQIKKHLDTAGVKNEGNIGKIITEIKYKPSSGATLKANPDKTTTILGSYKEDMANILEEMGNVKSTDLGAKKGGFNVLNVPDELYDPNTFWDLYNKPWLDEAIHRGDDIVIVTKPEGNVLTRIDYSTGEVVLTGFGQEIDYLTKNGYVYDTGTNTMKVRRY
jgi:hypothetical protein